MTSSRRPRNTSTSPLSLGRRLQTPSSAWRITQPLLTARGLYSPFVPRRLVLETLAPLPEDRKCFRMINGILVERTVKDVKPALQTNSEGLRKVLEDLVKQYKKQQDEMEKWKVRYVRKGPPIVQDGD